MAEPAQESPALFGLTAYTMPVSILNSWVPTR